MILREFIDHKGQRLEKLVQSLSESYSYEFDFDNLSVERATRMHERATAKLAESKDLKQRLKLSMIAESLTLWKEAKVQSELTSMVAEGTSDEELEASKVILAAQELSDKIQGMIEDAAKMQVQDLLPIVDAMKSDVGTAEAEAFSTSADAALGGLVDSLKSAKEEYDNAIAAAKGDATTDMDSMGMDDMGMDDMGGDMEMDDMEVDMSAMDDEDEFAGDAAVVGDEEPSGREMKPE